MKLYSYWRSSCSWRVRIALAHKQLDYTTLPVHLVDHGGEQRSQAYRAVNPLAEVPTLLVDHAGHEVALAQSLAILEYLEEAHPLPPLLPQDRVLRAKSRQMAQIVNAGVQPMQNLVVTEHVASLGADPKAWVGHWMARGLTALEAVAAPWAGACLVGDMVSFADVCLVPQLASARRFGVPVAAYPTLLRVEKHLNALPAFIAAHADKQVDAQTTG